MVLSPEDQLRNDTLILKIRGLGDKNQRVFLWIATASGRGFPRDSPNCHLIREVTWAVFLIRRTNLGCQLLLLRAGGRGLLWVGDVHEDVWTCTLYIVCMRYINCMDMHVHRLKIHLLIRDPNQGK